MEEVWRTIVGYEGLYAISNMGRVKSLNYGRTGKEKILRPCKDKDNYLQVGLYKGGKPKWYTVHRLVLSTFNPCENMDELQVNHIDENKENNNLSNLEWCTCKENCNHGTRNMRMAEKLRGRTLSDETRKKLSGAKRKLSKPIVQIDPSTNKIVTVWKSSHGAKREGGFNQGNIISCCKNKYSREGNNIYKSYKWQYLHVYIHNIDPRIKKVILFDKEYEF